MTDIQRMPVTHVPKYEAILGEKNPWVFADFYDVDVTNGGAHIPCEVNYNNFKRYWKIKLNLKLNSVNDYESFIEWFLRVKPESVEALIQMPSDSARDFVAIDAGTSELTYGGDQKDYKNLLGNVLKQKTLPSQIQRNLEKERDRIKVAYEKTLAEIASLEAEVKRCETRMINASPEMRQGYEMRIKQLEAQKAKKEGDKYVKNHGDFGAILNEYACGYVAAANVTAYEAMKASAKNTGLDVLYGGQEEEPFSLADFFVHMCHIAAYFVPTPQWGLMNGPTMIFDQLTRRMKKYAESRDCSVKCERSAGIDFFKEYSDVIGFIICHLEQDIPTIIGGKQLMRGLYSANKSDIEQHFVTATEVEIKSKNNIAIKISTYGEKRMITTNDMFDGVFVCLGAYTFKKNQNRAASSSSNSMNSVPKKPVTPKI